MAIKTITDHKRSARVAVRVREELAVMLARAINDPRVAGAVISRVEMPDDLQSARVYVRLAQSGDDFVARRRLLDGLKAASGKLRFELGKTLELRRAPELRFSYDEQLDGAMRIEKLLTEVAEEDKKK